jgi:hypothetical protein
MARKYRYPVLAVLAVPLLTSLSVVFHGFHSTANGQQSSVGSSADSLDPKQQQVWNSPQLLRARAWVEDYCSNSNLISEASAAQHLQTLSNMSPEEMQLFALRHEYEYQQQKKQMAGIQKAHEAALKQATAAAEAQKWWFQNVHKAENAEGMAVNQQTQQAYAAINREETGAANQEQSQINAQNAEASEMEEDKMGELNTAYPGFGYGGAYGYPAMGGYHYHFHVYPGGY